MNAPIASIVFFVIASFLGALGQFLYKSGADQSNGGILSCVLNARVLAGILCYVAVMVLFVAAYKRGGSLAVLYPIYATTFIWGAAIAYFLYATPIRPVNVLGMGCILLGMYCMGK